MRTPRSAAVGLAIAVMLVSGCTTTSPEETESTFCVPRVWVTPAEVSPGDTISVEVEGRCDAPTPPAGWVVRAAPVGQLESAVSTTVDAEVLAGFTVTLDLPADFPPGEAFAGLASWNYSDCPDNASCASASGGFRVVRE